MRPQACCPKGCISLQEPPSHTWEGQHVQSQLRPEMCPEGTPSGGLRGHRALVLEEALECAHLQHPDEQQHPHIHS